MEQKRKREEHSSAWSEKSKRQKTHPNSQREEQELKCDDGNSGAAAGEHEEQLVPEVQTIPQLSEVQETVQFVEEQMAVEEEEQVTDEEEEQATDEEEEQETDEEEEVEDKFRPKSWGLLFQNSYPSIGEEFDQECMIETMTHLREREVQHEDNKLLFAKLRLIFEPSYVNLRPILVQWMQDFCSECHQTLNTSCLSICIMDKFMAKLFAGENEKKLHPNRLQLIGAVSVLIASKFWENQNQIKVPTLIQYTVGQYTDLEFLAMEEQMLNALNWEMPVTPAQFLYPLLEQVRQKEHQEHYLLQVNKLATWFIEQSVLDSGLQEQFNCSMIVAAAVHAALHITTSKHWDTELELLSGYNDSLLLPCSAVFLNMHSRKLKRPDYGS